MISCLLDHFSRELPQFGANSLAGNLEVGQLSVGSSDRFPVVRIMIIVT